MIWQALITVLGQLTFAALMLAAFGWMLWTISPAFRERTIAYLTEPVEQGPYLYDYERENWFASTTDAGRPGDQTGPPLSPSRRKERDREIVPLRLVRQESTDNGKAV